MRCLELCAGGGGQALGLERAGFEHAALIELDRHAAATLRLNRPAWDVREADVKQVSGAAWRGLDLIAAGVPCPPFSKAGEQLGADDERDLFPALLGIVEHAQPRAVLIENVPGLLEPRFATYLSGVTERLASLGYASAHSLLRAAAFGVPQLRPRFVLIALRSDAALRLRWPQPSDPAVTVGDALADLMSSRGWPGAAAWSRGAQRVAPTLVGGSKKHGGADLGPTRAKRQWETLGVNACGVADEAPGPDDALDARPKLTVRMAARLQGFPDDWRFSGGKTAQYRQVANAFPPAVAAAVGMAIRSALEGGA